MTSKESVPEQPWYTAYPEPQQKSPGKIDKESLLKQFENGSQSGKEFLLIDVRRNDHEGGTIHGSLNLPAQSLYPSLPTLLELARRANVGRVIFYCGSSAGRGTRCAGWFDDLLSERKVSDIQSLILAGGIKGWAVAGPQYTKFVDEFDAAIWERYK